MVIVHPEAEAISYGVIRAASVVLLALIDVFLVAPATVDWAVLAIGLAWRAWLLIVVLPGVIAGLRAEEAPAD